MGVAFLNHYTPTISTDEISAIAKGYKFITVPMMTSRSFQASGYGASYSTAKSSIWSTPVPYPIRSVIVAGTIKNETPTYRSGWENQIHDFKASQYSTLAASETTFTSLTNFDVRPNEIFTLSGSPINAQYGYVRFQLTVYDQRIDIDFCTRVAGGSDDDHNPYTINYTYYCDTFPSFLIKTEFDI